MRFIRFFREYGWTPYRVVLTAVYLAAIVTLAAVA